VKDLKIADLFCGAGGTTTGAMQAINALGRDVEFVAVNHWPVAIATHEANHPNVRHYCKDLDTANPCEIVPEGFLDLLLASPECRFHSPAQGGRPLDEQNRASAWHVVRWAERLYIRRIVVENVPRFVKWGPLDRRGRPVKSREGELFTAWVRTLEAIGYRVEWRVLNAADYGTPQTRRRLFVQARRDGRRIVWPDRTHAPRGHEGTLHQQLETWQAARSAIRFDKFRHLARPVEEKSLSPKTLARIAEGVKRFCHGVDIEPFLVTLRNSRGRGPESSVTSLDDPLRTITCGRNHTLIEPFLIAHFGEAPGQKPRVHSIEDPLPTVTHRGAGDLIEPFVIPQGGGGIARSADEPLPTVATDGAIGVVEPFIVPQDQGAPARSVEEPLPTLRTTSRGVGVVEPFLLVKRQHDEARSLDEPLTTITGSGRNHFLVEPYLVRSNRGPDWGDVVRDLENPLPTITQKNGVGLVEPQIEGGRLVLLHRMLQPEELALGQDFDGYEFTGTREQQTKQIGNAVPIKLARAMTAAAFHDLAPAEIEECVA
jgi:DNA (cytosine-5)-methyltransferase 1